DANDAYAFRRTGTAWGSAKKIVALGFTSGGLGAAEAIGSTTLLFGAPSTTLSGIDDGQVLIYKDTGTDVGADGVMFSAPPTGAAGGTLGASLAIPPDGNTAYVGAPTAASDQGRVYVMVRTGAAWTLSRTLVPSDPTTAGFGSTVALSGTRLVVGAPASG